MSATTSSPPGSRSARHRSPLSRWRRAALVVLPVGVVLSLGAAFGPVWLARAGVLAALLTAVLVYRFARAELDEARHDHAVRSSRAAADHRSAIEREQRRQREQDERAETRAAAQRARVDDLERQVIALHGEVVEVGAVNHDLTVRLRAREDELAALTSTEPPVEAATDQPDADQDVADVRQLPRRLRRGATVTPDPGWDNLEVDVAVTG